MTEAAHGHWPAPDYAEITPYERPPDRPFAIICDVDGTLADFSPVRYEHGRKVWDYSGMAEAPAHEDVVLILQRLAVGTRVIYMTGRPEEYREATVLWLGKHVKLDGLVLMRKTGDYRQDYVIKAELFNAHVRHEYDVLCALDDRDQVCGLWRAIGLRCLQVAYGNF